MQMTETNAEGLKREFTVVVEAGDIAKRVETRLQEIGRQVGSEWPFRPLQQRAWRNWQTHWI